MRNLYLNNISVEEALAAFLSAFEPKFEHERINVTDALGRITAKAVYAECSSPLYDCAAMDGIAVISGRTHGASETRPLDIKKNEDYIIVDTGDPVRRPYDAVIMAEDIQELGDGAVRIYTAAAAWQHVRPIGEDIVQGEMILPGKRELRPFDIGVLHSGGITQIDVLKKPAVAIFPTGTELIEPGAEFVEGAIIESNSRMLEGLVVQGGGDAKRFCAIADDYAALKEKISEAADKFDMILINAGSSAGTEDYTASVLRELGEVLVHGVAMKPGKPVILAVVNGKPVVGVPGYPVSAYVAYTNFAAPVLSKLAGTAEQELPMVKATLTRRLVSSLKHREYVRVKVGLVGDKLVASPLARGAGAAMSLVRADGFCVIDQDMEGVEAGSEADIALIRPITELNATIVSIGSHDLILDIIADILRGAYLSSAHAGSYAGLLAVRNKEAHIAPTHLLDENTGEYNISYIKKIISEPTALVKGVGRLQGIIVAQGNPLNISGLEDLTRCRYINRQRGAGTRVLFDYKLKQAGVSPEDIAGYDREAATHMAVAAAVKSGSADAGMGIFSAAKALELDFIPVGDEEYDFAVPVRFLDLPHIKVFLECLRGEQFKHKLAELGGYTADRAGEVVIIER